ncbi:hypothetical protein [Streptomyces sp. NPDC008122]|uniref:hypothetical protein n=1 Tax=Streptomyces sp. NPDC008122 TaxID=3364810 RepID=UPI0036ED2710
MPLVVLAVGLGLPNGPFSSVATACVTKEQVGAASGISDTGRHVGPAVLTAVTAALFGSVHTRRHTPGTATADALAAGFSRAAIGLALFCAFGVALALLVGRFRPSGPPTTGEPSRVDFRLHRTDGPAEAGAFAVIHCNAPLHSPSVSLHQFPLS